MSNRSFLGCLTAIALVVIAVIAIPVISFSNDHAYTVTITDKERVTTQVAEGQIDSKYLIYGEDETERLMFSRTQIHCSDGNSIRLMFSVL